MTAHPVKWSVVTLSVLTVSYLQIGEALADSTNPLGTLQGTLNQVASQTTSQSSSSSPLSTLSGITQSLGSGSSTVQNVVTQATSPLTTNPAATSVLGAVSQTTGQLTSAAGSTDALVGAVKGVQSLPSLPSLPLQSSSGSTSTQTSSHASGGGTIQTPGLSGSIVGSISGSAGATLSVHTKTPSSPVPTTPTQVSTPTQSGGVTVSPAPIYNPGVPTGAVTTPSLLPETGSNDPLWIALGVAATVGSFLWWRAARRKTL